MQERRSSRRYAVSLKACAIITDTQQSYEGQVTDISFSGVRFVCSEKIEKNQQLELMLSIEEQDITLKAIVIWAERLDSEQDIHHGMKVVGVAFVGDSKKLESFFKKMQG